MSEETVCVFCEDSVDDDDHATLSEDDDPFDRADRIEGTAVHTECLRRHRVAVEQTKRMFRNDDRDPV